MAADTYYTLLLTNTGRVLKHIAQIGDCVLYILSKMQEYEFKTYSHRFQPIDIKYFLKYYTKVTPTHPLESDTQTLVQSPWVIISVG